MQQYYVLSEGDGADVAVDLGELRRSVLELAIDGVGNLLHVINDRRLLLQRIAVDLSRLIPVARLDVFDGIHAPRFN